MLAASTLKKEEMDQAIDLTAKKEGFVESTNLANQSAHRFGSFFLLENFIEKDAYRLDILSTRKTICQNKHRNASFLKKEK